MNTFFVVLFNFVDLIVPQVAQLHHELNLKDELLQFYTNAAEESEEGSGSHTSVHCFITLFSFVSRSRPV